jgi:hypothetical protein
MKDEPIETGTNNRPEVTDPNRLSANEEITLPLSVLVDQLAGSGPRDQSMVIRLALWWAERRSQIRLKFLDEYPLESVMITFRMEREVQMVVTGQLKSAPIDSTLHIHERDFPHVHLLLSYERQEDPPSIATLDYSVRGREYVLSLPYEGMERGSVGVAICLMTVDGAVLLRVRSDEGRILQLPEDVFELGPSRDL